MTKWKISEPGCKFVILVLTLFLFLLCSTFGYSQQGVLLANPTTPVPYNTAYMTSFGGSIVDFIQGYNPGGDCDLTYNPTTQQYSWTSTALSGSSGCFMSYQGPLAINPPDLIGISGMSGIYPDSGTIPANGSYPLTASRNFVESSPVHGYTYTFDTTFTGSWLEHYSSGPASAVSGTTIFQVFHDHCCFNTQEDAIDGLILFRFSTDKGTTWTATTVVPTQPCDGVTQCNPNLVMLGTNSVGNLMSCYVMFEISPSFGNFQGTYCQIYNVIGGTWSTPSKITALPSDNLSAKLYTSNGGINAMPGGCFGMAMWDGNSGNKTYLVTTCDDGATWGANGGSITLLGNSGTPIAIPSGQNETTLYWIPGTTKYIGFSRAAAGSSGSHDKNLKYIWSSDGLAWNIADTVWAASNNQISPLLLSAPGGKVTLLWAERIDVAPIARLHQLTFSALTTFGDASQFSDDQTIWTGQFNTWGYPAGAVIGNTLSFCWDTQLVAGSTRHIMCSTAEYAVPQGFISGAMFSGTKLQ
jgi:hypothetical protein